MTPPSPYNVWSCSVSASWSGQASPCWLLVMASGLEMANHVRRHVGQLDHGRDHNPSAAPLSVGPRRVARRPDERPQRGGRCSSAGLAKSGCCCFAQLRMIPTSVARLFPPPSRSSVPRPSTLVMFLDAPAPPSATAHGLSVACLGHAAPSDRCTSK